MRISLLTVLNSGEQCKVELALRFHRFSPRRKMENLLVGGFPQSPGKAALSRVLNARELTSWKEVCLQRPAGRAAAPLRAMKKAAVGGSFPGGGGSSTQQACRKSAYTSALIATIVFGGIGIPGAFMWNDRRPVPRAQVK